jgi:hypothetical protein
MAYRIEGKRAAEVEVGEALRASAGRCRKQRFNFVGRM